MHRYPAGDAAAHGGNSWIGTVVIVAVAVVLGFLMVRAHRKDRRLRNP